MHSTGRILVATMAITLILAAPANGQSQSLQEIQDGISIRTARLETAVRNLKLSADPKLFNANSINISLLPGPANLSWYSAGEAVLNNNRTRLLTKSGPDKSSQLAKQFAFPIMPSLVPGLPELQFATSLARQKDLREKPTLLLEVPVPTEAGAKRLATPQTFIRVHNGRKYLKQELAQSGWRYIDPATLRQQPLPHPNDGVPPPAPATEPVD